VIGGVCHIRAANPRGPRYDPGQAAGERHGPANLIVLCANQLKAVDDDPDACTVERLARMKADHEGKSSGLTATVTNLVAIEPSVAAPDIQSAHAGRVRLEMHEAPKHRSAPRAPTRLVSPPQARTEERDVRPAWVRTYQEFISVVRSGRGG